VRKKLRNREKISGLGGAEKNAKERKKLPSALREVKGQEKKTQRERKGSTKKKKAYEKTKWEWRRKKPISSSLDMKKNGRTLEKRLLKKVEKLRRKKSCTRPRR